MSHVKTLENEKEYSFFRDLLIVVSASILIGLFSRVAIPLPWTPVPLATQNIVVLLLAMFLGPKRAVGAVVLFITQGAFGLPVFAGAVGGFAKLLGPTGGYLVGYAIGAFVVGHLAARWKQKTFLNAALTFGAGSCVIYLFGASYLAYLIGVEKAISLGVLPFLIGDAFKILVASQIVQWVNRK